MKIALTGNPNSGKTTLFNALTGRAERVGNWAGVTVDKKESKLKASFAHLANGKDITVVDLPGAYSMSAFTSEESVTSDYVKNENLDVLINIVDATNLSRSLFFTTQLLELGIPTVIALNKTDINEKNETSIDVKMLSAQLGCPVVETVSTNQNDDGLVALISTAVNAKGSPQTAPFSQNNAHVQSKAAAQKADRARYAFVNGVVRVVETRKVLTSTRNAQDKVDAVLASTLVGIPFFALVMWAVFALSQTYVGPFFADILCEGIDAFGVMVGDLLVNASPFLHSLLVDGIIGGVGAVVGFLPLVMVMYFLIALLEDCGYMARVAMVMDPFFKKVGLSGKSIIPMVIGTGCSIPGVMACRTIKNERERRTTAMLTPFMPCGAKLPVIALFATAFFDEASWVGTLMYFCGVALILLGAILVYRITGQKYRKSYFIMELPVYKVPSLWKACLSMMSRAKEFIIKAGTVILVCNAAVQIMQTFDWHLQVVEEGASNSMLASVSSPIAVLLIPLGFGAWQLAAAAISGFIAKENVVGTLAVMYGITNFSGAQDVASAMHLTATAALAYLMFNLFTPPCFAAIGAMNAELQDKKWLFGGLALQFGTGYTMAFLVYQIGTVITTGAVGTGFVPGLVAVVVLLGILVVLIRKADAQATVEHRTRRTVKN